MTPVGYWSIISIADELTVVCKGTLDLANVQELRDAIKCAVDMHGAKSIVLDWVRVDFVDSQALAVPLDLARTFNLPLRIRAAVDTQPARVLKISSLDAVFTIHFIPCTEPGDN